MEFSQNEKYVLAMIASGMLAAGYEQGIITENQYEKYSSEACAKVGANNTILLNKLHINPFMTIQNMDSQKKNFVKSFLYQVLEKVPNCDAAAYYFATTLQNSGLTN